MNQKATKAVGRGGIRKGAGRPAKFKKGESATISLVIPTDLLKTLDAEVENQGVSRSDFIRGLIQDSVRKTAR